MLHERISRALEEDHRGFEALRLPGFDGLGLENPVLVLVAA